MANAGNPKCLAQFKLDSSNDTYVTVPANKRWTLSMIHIANTDDTARNVTLNHVLNGDSPGVENTWIPASSIPSGDFIEMAGGAVLEEGDTIQGFSADQADVIGVSMYGIEEDV